jgi:hypothetical protein
MNIRNTILLIQNWGLKEASLPATVYQVSRKVHASDHTYSRSGDPATRVGETLS